MDFYEFLFEFIFLVHFLHRFLFQPWVGSSTKPRAGHEI